MLRTNKVYSWVVPVPTDEIIVNRLQAFLLIATASPISEYSQGRFILTTQSQLLKLYTVSVWLFCIMIDCIRFLYLLSGYHWSFTEQIDLNHPSNFCRPFLTTHGTTIAVVHWTFSILLVGGDNWIRWSKWLSTSQECCALGVSSLNALNAPVGKYNLVVDWFSLYLVLLLAPRVAVLRRYRLTLPPITLAGWYPKLGRVSALFCMVLQ